MNLFNPSDLVNSAPLLVLTVAGLVVLLLDAFSRSKLVGLAYQKKMPAETSEAAVIPEQGSRKYLMPLTVLSLLFTLASLVWLSGEIGESTLTIYSRMLVVDRFGIFLIAVCTAGALLGALGAPGYLRAHRMEFGEYYALILFALAGMVILILANDLVAVFLGVETMSLGAYVLTGSWRRSARSSEAALKYFLVGAFVSGLLVYGIALIYGSAGTTVLPELRQQASRLSGQPMFYIGSLLVLVSFAFKIAAVPFHMWAPDAYEGAPTPVSAFMMSSLKAAGFAGLVRIAVGALGAAETSQQAYTGWIHSFAILAILTMTIGNLAALRQDNIKRMLGYSSISHAGYLLIGVIAMSVVGDEARGPLLYYLLAYTITVVSGMAVVSWLGADDKGEERVRLEDWAGLASQRPGAALAMTICLLSLGGFPPTAGFFGKFYLFKVALQSPSMLPLVLIAIANSLISVFYYLRIITAMYFRSSPTRPAVTPVDEPSLSWSVLIGTLLILGFGMFPDWLSKLAAAATMASMNG